MTAILPPLQPWSGNTQNKCGFDEILTYWKACDVITFLADLGMYHASLYNFLDEREKEHVQKFKTDYFKKRFTISRSIIKLILQNILDTETYIRYCSEGKRKTGALLSGAGRTCISACPIQVPALHYQWEKENSAVI